MTDYDINSDLPGCENVARATLTAISAVIIVFALYLLGIYRP